MTGQLEISINGASRAETDRLAGELQTILLRAVPDAQIKRERTDADAMEIGSIISIIVGSHAAVALARGLQSFIGRIGTSSITISEDGEVKGTNLTSADTVRITELVLASHHRR